EALQHLGEVPGLFVLPIHLYAVPAPLPRTYAVSGARVVPAAERLAALLDPAFDPRREVVLETGEAATAEGTAGESRIVEARPDGVVLEATLARDGYVVLLDSYDPGWRASLDGRPAPVLRANVAFRALRVPAGRHRIEYVYRPRAVMAGLLISAAALVLTTLL